jgi:hypothetical protein
VIQVNRIEFSLNALAKKEGPDTLQVEAKGCAFWPYGGRSPAFEIRRTRI